VSSASEPSRQGGPAREPSRRRGLFWALVPVGLLGGILSMHAVLLAGVIEDPSFAVEKDYYDKAVSWDAKMAQDRENTRLGWSAEVATAGSGRDGRVTVRIMSPGDVPVARARVRVEAFHNARASRVASAVLEESTPGVYGSALRLDRPGLWEFRVVVERGTDRFTAVVRRDVGIGGGVEGATP
jgi:nitrogen fixation protein FixH